MPVIPKRTVVVVVVVWCAGLFVVGVTVFSVWLVCVSATSPPVLWLIGTLCVWVVVCGVLSVVGCGYCVQLWWGSTHQWPLICVLCSAYPAGVGGVWLFVGCVL